MSKIKVSFSSNGKPDSVYLNRGTDSDPMWASLPFNPTTKTFNPTKQIDFQLLAEAQALPEWATLDLSDRPSEPPTLEAAKATIYQQIIDETARRQDALISGYSYAEATSWDEKEKEAKALVASNDIDQAPYLRVEAITATGATTPEEILSATQALAQRILQKADHLRTQTALIAGNRGKLRSQVEALATVEEVMSFDVNQGWP